METGPQKTIGRRTIGIGIGQAGLWAVLCFAVIETVPKFQKIFADFGVDLPGITQLLIAVSYLLYRYWYLAIVVAFLLNWGVASLLWSSPDAVVARRAWYVVTWLAPVVLLALVMIALFVPLLSLLSAISR